MKLKLKPEWLLTKEKPDGALEHKHARLEENIEASTKKNCQSKSGVVHIQK